MVEVGGRGVEALALVRRDPAAAEAAARDALVGAVAAGDRAGEAVARRVLGIVARDGHRFVEARRELLAGVEAAERGGSVELAALCRMSLATTLSLVGDADGAVAAIDAAVAVLSGQDGVRARFQRAAVLQGIGDRDGALAAYAAVEADLRGHDDVVTVAASLQLILARNLRRLRSEQGLSQEAFAHKSGIHRTYIGGIERGERNVTLQTLARIADALRVDPADLLRAV